MWHRHGAALLGLLALGGCPGGFCGGAGPDQAEASLYLSDATSGALIRNPVFTEGDQRLSSSCEEPELNDPGLCAGQRLIVEPVQHTIVVGAPGYETQSIVLDATNSLSIHLAIALRPSAP